MPTFTHFDLRLLNPAFDSPLVDVLTELQHLRRLRLAGSTPAPVFFQLKHVFHILESLGSARIEGNHTTLADYVESAVSGQDLAADPLREIANIEQAIAQSHCRFLQRPREILREACRTRMLVHPKRKKRWC